MNNTQAIDTKVTNDGIIALTYWLWKMNRERPLDPSNSKRCKDLLEKCMSGIVVASPITIKVFKIATKKERDNIIDFVNKKIKENATATENNHIDIFIKKLYELYPDEDMLDDKVEREAEPIHQTQIEETAFHKKIYSILYQVHKIAKIIDQKFTIYDPYLCIEVVNEIWKIIKDKSRITITSFVVKSKEHRDNIINKFMLMSLYYLMITYDNIFGIWYYFKQVLMTFYQY